MKSLFGRGAKRGAAATEIPARSIDRDRLRTVLDFFPIGKKLRYYPEFKQEVVFDTLVVGYGLNDDFVYSGEAIARDADGCPLAFLAGRAAAPRQVGELRLFQLLVPDTTDLEMTLDYHRRALIGRKRQFTKGNCISLISHAGARGVSTLDTEVAGQVVLPDGPYAGSKMIVLTPLWPTLAVSDQRSRARARTSAPVAVTIAGARLPGPCTIVDIAEDALRIRVREQPLPALPAGGSVMLELDLGEAERHYTIHGREIRRSPETCVVRLDGRLKDGKLARFEALDLLELKAGLLNYGR